MLLAGAGGGALDLLVPLCSLALLLLTRRLRLLCWGVAGAGVRGRVQLGAGVGAEGRVQCGAGVGACLWGRVWGVGHEAVDRVQLEVWEQVWQQAWRRVWDTAQPEV